MGMGKIDPGADWSSALFVTLCFSAAAAAASFKAISATTRMHARPNRNLDRKKKKKAFGHAEAELSNERVSERHFWKGDPDTMQFDGGRGKRERERKRESEREKEREAIIFATSAVNFSRISNRRHHRHRPFRRSPTLEGSLQRQQKWPIDAIVKVFCCASASVLIAV
jgi:hypothetical protein